MSEATDKGTVESANKPASDAKPVKKGYTNPALKAMGINSIRLPSRNWTIFLTTVGLLVGGAIYDKREQKKIREKWMKKAEPYGQQTIDAKTTPRKVTIYISPPPNDYLEESFKMYRRYIKPILNAGGIDMVCNTSNTQGLLRHRIAGDIRNQRRSFENIQQKKEEPKPKDNEWRITKAWNSLHSKYFISEDDKRELEKKQEADKVEEFQKKLKNPKNFLSVYLNDKEKETPLKVHNEDESKPLSESGGVICLGRGTFKEYFLGINEGLLGPLEKPERVILAQAQNQHEILTARRERKLNRLKKDEELKDPEVKSVDELIEDIKLEGNKNDGLFKRLTDDPEDERENDYEIQPDPIKSYLLPKEYHSMGKIAPEFKSYLNNNEKIPTENDIPPVFQQTISVMPVPHLLGFLSIPERIWRFYNRRYLADEYGRLAFNVVKNVSRPFEENDINLAKEEENDWPKKWLQTSIDKEKDWVTDLRADERVTKNLRVYVDDCK